MAAFYARVSQDQHCAVTAAKSEKCWLSVDMLLALLANYAGLCTAWMLSGNVSLTRTCKHHHSQTCRFNFILICWGSPFFCCHFLRFKIAIPLLRVSTHCKYKLKPKWLQIHIYFTLRANPTIYSKSLTARIPFHPKYVANNSTEV